MTADPSRSPDRPPAWWVATDQGVVLSGPFDDWPRALVGHARAIARIRESLERDCRPPAFIAARCEAIAARWGALAGAWQHFECQAVVAVSATMFAQLKAGSYCRCMTTHQHHGSEDYDSAASWDARYGEVEQRWSGHANSSLVAAVGDLPTGRALEVGCGEGADAIWLARRGWDVTAIDISEVAVSRARAAAGDLPITWLVADLAANPPAGVFDLVSLQYPALRKSEDDAVVAAILRAVASGGRLLVVGHDVEAMRAHNRMPAGLDPDDYVLPDDVALRLGEDWTFEMHGTRPRVQPPGYDGPDIPDNVLLARRS